MNTLNTSQIKTALVTGASRGIGRAIALRLAKDGFGVLANYAGSSGAAKVLVAEIEQSGGRALAVQADVCDPGAFTHLFDTAEKDFGGVDVLVNNAGIMLLSPIAEADVGFAVLDRLRAEMLHRVGLSDLLKPRILDNPLE